MKKIKRLLPLLLILLLLLGIVPFSAFAQEGASGDPPEATPTSAPDDSVSSGGVPDETSPTAETATPTATPASAPETEPPIPAETAAPTDAPTSTTVPTEPTQDPPETSPEVDPPSENEPYFEEPWGEGIFEGPNNPPEGSPLLMSIAAGTATIAIRGCYNSAGSVIKYVSSFYYDGRWVGGNGSSRHIIYANEEPAYCLEPGKYLVGGNTVTTNAATIWNGFSSAKKNAIKLAILCGAEGNASNLSGSYGSQYTATQMVIWEFVMDVRSTASPYSLSDSKVINSVCSGGANSEVKTVYDQIVAAMQSYNTLPSFANSLDAPPPQQEMSYSGGKYTITLTDSNGVLGNYNVTSTDGNVKVSVSGNKLTLTSSAAVSGATINLERKSAVSASSQITAYAAKDLQETIIGIEAVGGTSGYFGVYTTGGPTPTPKPTPTPTPTPTPRGNVKIVKTSDDGKVSGIQFTVKGGSINQTVTSGSDGTITVPGLTPGSYTVTETVPAGYTADRASQSVTVRNGETTTVSFHNTRKTGSVKIVKTSDDGKVSGIQFTVNQIISTLPVITSAASQLTTYTFVDQLSQGITHNKGDVLIEFFRDKGCTEKIATWTEADGKFLVSYAAEQGGSSMTISMTDTGLAEINTNENVYGTTGVQRGYSACTMRITYAAAVNSDASVIYGDGANPNEVVLQWRRTNSEYYDTLNDDCHVYVYGLDLTKEFSDGAGNFDSVKMVVHNDTDSYFVQANLQDGIYYVTGHTQNEDEATVFTPVNKHIIVKGLEDDAYSITETATADGYTLLKEAVKVVISTAEGGTCDVCHKPLLTASAAVNGNAADMAADGESVNALVQLTVVNTKGFDLPQTGGRGTWLYTTIGIVVMAGAAAVIFFIMRRRSNR